MSTQKPHFLPPLPFTCLRGVRTSAPSSSLHPQGPWPRSDLSGLGACCSCGSQPYPKALPPWDGDLEAPNTCPGRTPHLCSLSSYPHRCPFHPQAATTVSGTGAIHRALSIHNVLQVF